MRTWQSNPLWFTNKMLRPFCYLLSMILAASSAAASQRIEMSREARDYLDRAFSLMQRDTLYRKDLDWRQLRRESERYALGATKPWETYPALAYACAKPRNRFCRLVFPANTPAEIVRKCKAIEADLESSSHGKRLTPTTPLPSMNRALLLAVLNSARRKYGYLVLPKCESDYADFADPARRHVWAENVAAAVARAQTEGVSGWILDLRGNTGGFLAPMLAGIQAVLGEGTVLEISGPENKSSFSIEEGKVIRHFDRRAPAVAEYLDERVSYSNHNVPIALLQDRGTQEAGEALLIAFKGRSNTRFIGTRTVGFTHIGTNRTLSDGARLWVMEAEVSDRNGNRFPEGVAPDIEVQNPPVLSIITEDPVVRKAEEWLSEQP